MEFARKSRHAEDRTETSTASGNTQGIELDKHAQLKDRMMRSTRAQMSMRMIDTISGECIQSLAPLQLQCLNPLFLL